MKPDTTETERQREPFKPFAEWRAMGPVKAAEYLARRNGWDAERQAKLRAILEDYWHDSPPKSELFRFSYHD